MAKEIDFSKPLNEFDWQYVQDRSWMKGEAERLGFTVERELSPEEQIASYDELSSAKLQEEIDARNEEYDEDDQIEPVDDSKPELIAALAADDAKHADDE